MALITKLRSVVKGPPLLFLDRQPIAGWRKSDFEYTRALTAGAGADWRTSVRLAPAEPCRCTAAPGALAISNWRMASRRGAGEQSVYQTNMHAPATRSAGGWRYSRAQSRAVPTCHLPALGNGGMNCTSVQASGSASARY